MEAAPPGFGLEMANVAPNETVRKVIRYDKKVGAKVEMWPPLEDLKIFTALAEIPNTNWFLPQHLTRIKMYKSRTEFI